MGTMTGKFEAKSDRDGPLAALVRRVASSARKQNAQLGLFDTDAIIRALFDELGAELLEKGRLWIPEFGTFTMRTRKGRTLKFLIGKPAHYVIPERLEVHFRAAKSLTARAQK